MTRSAVGRAVVLAAMLGSVALLSSCAAVLGAIEDRLPPPHEVSNGILFQYYAPSARQVTLAGNFNNWAGTQGGGRYDPDIDPMVGSATDGIWKIVVPLPPGRYQYKYVIDGGVRWERDPNNPDTAFEGGIENSLIVVPPTIDYKYEVVTGTVIAGEQRTAVSEKPSATENVKDVVLEAEFPGASSVSVAGDFNEWNAEKDKLKEVKDGVFSITLKLAPGTYEYKFVVDGAWKEDPANSETVPDPYGGVNSVLKVE